MKEIRQSISYNHVVLSKVRLVGSGLKGEMVVDGANMIRSEKLREQQYTERYARSLEGKKKEWDEGNNNNNYYYY